MAWSNSEIINRFANGATKGKSANIFIEGDVLYDFGRHFPLLIRMPSWGPKVFNEGSPLLMNADKYSVTTSAHQSIAARKATLQIPFSALYQAIDTSYPKSIQKG